MSSTRALSDLTELVGMTRGSNGRVQVLTNRLREALRQPSAEEQRELFVATVLLLQARQRGAIAPEVWERVWNAADALLEPYGIKSCEDLQALDLTTQAAAEPQRKAA